jgi:hypothetical protein
MNMPGFAAESSLYRTSRHYQTSRSVVNSRPGLAGAIPTAIKDETIEVFSCGPGSIQVGAGENMVCVNPSDPFGIGGHSGGGSPDLPDLGGPPSGGGPAHQPGPGFCRMPVGPVETKGAIMRQEVLKRPECRTFSKIKGCCRDQVSKCEDLCDNDSNACIQHQSECRAAFKVCTGELPVPKAGELPLCT